jgi:hypothetical protein
MMLSNSIVNLSTDEWAIHRRVDGVDGGEHSTNRLASLDEPLKRKNGANLAVISGPDGW